MPFPAMSPTITKSDLKVGFFSSLLVPGITGDDSAIVSDPLLIPSLGIIDSSCPALCRASTP